MVKKTDFNTKVTEIEGKITDVSSLVKKTDYATEITSIKNAYVTNTALNARHRSLIQKSKFDTEVKKINDQIASNSSEVLTYNNRLNQSKDRIDELEKIVFYFRCKIYFDGDGIQNYLVFQGVYKYFDDVNVSKTIIKLHVNSWISKELSDEKISSVSEFTRPFIEYTNARIKLKFDGIVLREKLSTSLRLIANYYIAYRLNRRTNSSNIVLENCLFGKIKMTKNADTDKYKYQGHGTGFDLSGIFSHPNGGDGKNVVIFGVDMTNSKHANNKTKDVLILGQGLIQKIDDTTIYAEKMYSPSFTVANKTFCLSLHHNGGDSYLFVNAKKVIWIYRYIYDFSVDYSAISNDKIHDIHAYLMKKNGTKQMLKFI